VEFGDSVVVVSCNGLGTGFWSSIAAPRAAARGATIKYLWRSTGGSADNNLGTTIKYLRRTMSGAAGSGLGTTTKYL